ncbi:MAG: thioredoxin family protein [bacterium]|nr:thioredoxin family protein [bacterium]
MYNGIVKSVILEELSSPGCSHCKAFEEYWHSIEKDWPNVTYKNTSIITPEGQALATKHMIFASPGIIINGELHATGGFDKEKFLTALKISSS